MDIEHSGGGFADGEGNGFAGESDGERLGLERFAVGGQHCGSDLGGACPSAPGVREDQIDFIGVCRGDCGDGDSADAAAAETAAADLGTEGAGGGGDQDGGDAVRGRGFAVLVEHAQPQPCGFADIDGGRIGFASARAAFVRGESELRLGDFVNGGDCDFQRVGVLDSVNGKRAGDGESFVGCTRRDHDAGVAGVERAGPSGEAVDRVARARVECCCAGMLIFIGEIESIKADMAFRKPGRYRCFNMSHDRGRLAVQSHSLAKAAGRLIASRDREGGGGNSSPAGSVIRPAGCRFGEYAHRPANAGRGNENTIAGVADCD